MVEWGQFFGKRQRVGKGLEREVEVEFGTERS